MQFDDYNKIEGGSVEKSINETHHNEDIIETEQPRPALSEFAKKQYLDYAISVVTGRALPSVSDGLKPVHRRILFSMYKMGLLKAPKHVKSARVVGDVLGKYHPHGDSSVYDAMVRMAQPWSLRYPLVDGQGNFGSLDGDNAAAMRYTESKLRPISELLLSEIDEGTVDFVANYDGVDIEPSMLPARLPFILLNGSYGIAVGMATEIPSHNLREIAGACVELMRTPEMDNESLLDLIPGPDFPCGGQIISLPSEIRAAMSGKGSLRVRARWAIEKLARGQWQVAVSELPPGISIAKIMFEIEARSNPEPKIKAGKKYIPPADLNLKTSFLNSIDAVRDESDKNHGTRLVIEPKSSRDSPDDLMQLLLAYTSLEINVSANLTVLGLNKFPKTVSIIDILREWCTYRFNTVTRRTNHRLTVAEKRIHILEGRMAIIMDIDKAIRIIRAAENPKQELMDAFNLSEIQAEDVLDIRLRQLARLEGIKIGEELASLQKDATYLRHLLGSDDAMRALIAKEIESDGLEFGDDRRTLIEPSEKVTAQNAKSVATVNEPVTVIISKQGWLRARQGHADLDPAQIVFRSGDSLMKVIACRTTDNLSILDQNGRVYTIDVGTLPGGKGDGAPLTSIVDMHDGGKILFASVFGSEEAILVATSGGYGFRCKGSDLVSRNKAGKAFLTTPPGERPVIFCSAPSEDKEIACITKDGRCLIFKIEEFKFLPKGRGLKLISADPGDTEMISIELTLENIDESRIQACRSSRGGKGRSLTATSVLVKSGFNKQSIKSGGNDPITLIIGQSGDIRLLPHHNLSDIEIAAQFQCEKLTILRTKESDHLSILDNNGRVYSVLVGAIAAMDGEACTIGSVVDLHDDGKMVFAQTIISDDSLLVATSGGYGFRCKGEDLLTRNKNGKAFLTIQEGERPVTFCKAPKDGNEVACATYDGRGLVFMVDEIKFLPKGRGLKLIEAAPGLTEMTEIILDLNLLNQDRLSVCRSNRGGKGRQLAN